MSPGWHCILLRLAALSAHFLASSASPKEQAWALDIPRLTVDELESNATMRKGLHAFVLTGFLDKWRASNWTLKHLKKKIPFEWVDYYPENMEDVGNKPYLFKFEDALPRFKEPSPKPRYMQLRLGLRGWTRLKKDFSPKPVPDVFWDDDGWIEECMKNEEGKVDRPAIDNFFTTNQWKFLLIGEKGTSMFFHKDGTAASSWQAQLIGRKKWTLCPNTESHLLSEQINTFNPDYARFPRFAQALCGSVTMHPGELLYYPAYWWHQTYQLDTPSISYTGALVGVEADRHDLREPKPHAQFYADLMGKCAKCWRKGVAERQCDDISLKWPGAAPPPMRVVCENYLPECFKKWDKHARSLHDGGSRGEEL